MTTLINVSVYECLQRQLNSTENADTIQLYTILIHNNNNRKFFWYILTLGRKELIEYLLCACSCVKARHGTRESSVPPIGSEVISGIHL